MRTFNVFSNFLLSSWLLIEKSELFVLIFKVQLKLEELHELLRLKMPPLQKNRIINEGAFLQKLNSFIFYLAAMLIWIDSQLRDIGQ